ncbi:MAG TPA: UDP-N-acetylmuramate--L-alanine ligase [Actinomycetota bacterium]|nr:UDP-N-acetylmuramate--L-alanine ligase [Actinomycetota bacterium]
MRSGLGRPLRGTRVHFVGIGGVGMAALAELLHAMGYEVSGSDLKESEPVRRLEALGAKVHVGSHEPHHADGAEHVIVSAAVSPTNPEVVRAREAGAEVIMRAELLGRIFDAGRGIAVAGTHGKTTTSSMLAMILERAGMDPSFVIGGDLNDVGSGARLGAGDLVVAEADEAFSSFLHLRPELAVVTNVDIDHLDHFGTPEAIDEAFLTFLDQRRPDGPAVLCVDDPGIARLRERVRGPVVTYGTSDADLVVSRSEEGWWRLTWRGVDAGTLRLSVPGLHHVLDAAGAAAAAFLLGARPEETVEALSAFTGVERRFSVRGVQGGVTVVDDYAHHPREIEATLQAARERYAGSQIVALFQPHLYSRTRDLAEEFGKAFADADVVVITDVYGARETPIPGVSGRSIWDTVQHNFEGGQQIAIYAPLLDEAAGLAAGMVSAGDVIVTLGAGDVTTAGPRILEMLQLLEPG